MLERLRNKHSGMRGYFATFHSIKINNIKTSGPNIRRHSTLADDHGCVTPPKVSPRSNIIVAPATERLPSQSTARRPATIGVFGVWRCRMKRMIKNARPVIGTRLVFRSVMKPIDNPAHTVEVETPAP